MATSASTSLREATEAGGPPIPPKRGKKARSRRWRTLALATGTAIASAALAWALSTTSPLQLLELKTYDLRFVLRGKQPPPPNIVLVTIDEKTEDALPEPKIFWHPHYAALFRAAAAGGARALGLDAFFAISVEPWAPDLDRELAAAFMEASASMPIVLAYDSLHAFPESLPLYMFAGAQGAMGFANVTFDPDGFIRRQELQGQGPDAPESFATRLASLVLGQERGVLDEQNSSIRFGDHAVPLDSSGFLLIHYWGPGGTFPAVSMAEVLAAARQGQTEKLKQWFDGKTLLVGTLDPTDRRPTPFYLAGGGQSLTPGVEIHANALGTLLEKRFLREAPPAATLTLVLAGAALASLCIFRIGFPWAPLTLLGTVAVYLVATVVSLQFDLVLPVVPPVLAVAVSGLASYGAYSRTEDRQRRLLQEVFGRYVSSEVAREVMEQGEVPLGGSYQRVTVMFSDIRDYTGYCQGRDPRLVVEELNEFFAEMTAEIKAHSGMINKFIGDGIMALFGAPVPHPDDARRAVRSALGMVKRNREYNQRRTERGLRPLVIGIGLHTGDAVVGNIGAPEKMEYTAIGDTVNVASRIEGENKTFHSQLLVSEATYEEIRQDVVAELAGHAKLKGVAEPMAVYKILELKGGDA